MKYVYKDFQELYSTLRGKTVEIKPKEYVPKVEPKAEPKEEPKAEEPKEEKPKKKATRKKKEA